MRTPFNLALSSIFSILVLFVIGSSAQDIDQLVRKLTANPNDTTTREQIIKLANEMKPSPPIPESARRAFLQGNAITKEAKDADGQRLAVQKFYEGTNLAPWWSDAYFNLAVTQELIGSLADARATWAWYLKTKPGEKEERAAQDRIYGIEAKEELIKTTTANQVQRQRDEERQRVEKEKADRESLMRSLDGAVFRQPVEPGSVVYARDEIRIAGVTPAITFRRTSGRDDAPKYCLRPLDANLECRFHPPAPAGNYLIFRVSQDGRSATTTNFDASGRQVQVLHYKRVN